MSRALDLATVFDNATGSEAKLLHEAARILREQAAEIDRLKVANLHLGMEAAKMTEELERLRGDMP